MNFKIISIFFIFLCLFSCKKQVEKERPEFIGTWVATYSAGADFVYEIDIDQKSNGVYIEYTQLGGGPKKTYGTARANNNRLKIGVILGFKIIEYPHKIDTTNSNITVPLLEPRKKANWKMVLKRGTFYKADY